MKCGVYFLTAGILACFAGAGAGCSGRTERLDRRDENHPLMRRAMARKQARDTDRAVDLFQQALERRPSLARAHLELGLLYDEDKEDYMRAAYHYERYLEMRPQAEKREMVERLIRDARLSYAASLPHQPSGAVQRISELQRENERLRSELTEVQDQVTKLRSHIRTQPDRERPASAPSGNAAPASQRVAAPRAETETYVVQPGDTLSRIASLVYGDPTQWSRLYEANRDVLNGPGSLRTGQQLVIPRNEGRPSHE